MAGKYLISQSDRGKTYQLFEILGKGSYGVVYRATDNTNQEFAIKKISLEKLNKDEREMININREVNILASLIHPNIITYYDSWQTSSNVYIVTEFCMHRDLWYYIKYNGTPNENRLRIWIQQIAEALNHIHEKNYVHRNIKPQNVMVSDKLSLKLGDFGTARLMPNENVTMTVVGTPYFMSPEMMSQQPYRAATDIWSFGCLCYAVVSGNILHEGKTFTKLIKIVQRGVQVDELFGDLHISDDVKSIIARMLSSCPSDRPTAECIVDYFSCQDLDEDDSTSPEPPVTCRDVNNVDGGIEVLTPLGKPITEVKYKLSDVSEQADSPGAMPKHRTRQQYPTPWSNPGQQEKAGVKTNNNKLPALKKPLPPIARAISHQPDSTKDGLKIQPISQNYKFPKHMDLSKTCPAAIWYTSDKVENSGRNSRQVEETSHATPSSIEPGNDIHYPPENEEEIAIQQFLCKGLGEDVYAAGLSCLIARNKERSMADLQNAIGDANFVTYSIFFSRIMIIQSMG